MDTAQTKVSDCITQISGQVDVVTCPWSHNPWKISSPSSTGSTAYEYVRVGPSAAVTQRVAANAALFDAANNFAGCIAGIHEVLRRQGLLEGTWCLNPDETMSPGQSKEIDRVYAEYAHLTDDQFVQEGLASWLQQS